MARFAPRKVQWARTASSGGAGSAGSTGSVGPSSFGPPGLGFKSDRRQVERVIQVAGGRLPTDVVPTVQPGKEEAVRRVDPTTTRLNGLLTGQAKS